MWWSILLSPRTKRSPGVRCQETATDLSRETVLQVITLTRAAPINCAGTVAASAAVSQQPAIQPSRQSGVPDKHVNTVV